MVEMLRHLFPLHDYDPGAVMRALLDTLVQVGWGPRVCRLC
jgi:hypothetical protein